jgi:tRNA-dihydrouridine synthase
MKSRTLILGNGDLRDVDDAKQKIKETGADGAMLGRAIFGRPWLFAAEKLHGKSLGGGTPSRVEWDVYKDFSQEVFQRLNVAVEHTKLFEELLGDVKNFAIMKKHFKAYCEGFPGAKELRVKLMETSNAAEVEEIIEVFLRSS